jgi:7-keto-8-aminopelargonate synthetase-like enzyme
MSAIKFLFRILFNKQSRTDSKISSNFGQEQFKIKKMAKIKHNNFIDTVDEVLSGAKKEGVLHLYAEHKILTGRTIKIKGKEVFHFGTTGYLGLEQDIRLKEAAIAAINNYGSQFPLSKSYISDPLYSELEQKMK